jgi:hypothetical protein
MTEQQQRERHGEYHHWSLDRRFYYVWLWGEVSPEWSDSGYGTEWGPRIAVCDDFGQLQPVTLEH